MILDMHTHQTAPNPEAIIDLSDKVKESDDFFISAEYSPEQRFSVGIHPWILTDEVPSGLMERVGKAAVLQQVAIIGETGIDIPKGGPLFRQMLVFKQMIELSERVGKPLLVHNVKAHDIIIGLHKEMRPQQPWIIHGFRSKPTVADMFIREGMYLSFGQYFNPVSVHNVPHDRILAETDESGLSIKEIIHFLSDTRGIDLTHSIAENTARLLG